MQQLSHKLFLSPAAFGRLCVETDIGRVISTEDGQPPSGGCVLKLPKFGLADARQWPAAFGRLCVETIEGKIDFNQITSSRLRAAVC